MRLKYCKIIAAVFGLFWLSFPAAAGEKGTSAPGRPYELKVKVRPLVTASRVVWQNDSAGWKAGFFDAKESVPLLIVEKENFYPEEKDFSGAFSWGKDKVCLLVLNPRNAALQADLAFSANSYKKSRKFEIRVNGRLKEKIEIPAKKEGFADFTIKDMVLFPGLNGIEMVSPEGTDILKPHRRRKDETVREVSAAFRRFEFAAAREYSGIDAPEKLFKRYRPQRSAGGAYAGLRPGGMEKYYSPRPGHFAAEEEKFADIRAVKHDGFTDFIFARGRLFLLTRDVDVDLEEFPWFNLAPEFKQGAEARAIVFLGVDYTNDGEIDDYSAPDFFTDVNVFEEAKDAWPQVNHYQDGFVVKKIIVLVLPEEEPEFSPGIVRLKDPLFYNPDSLAAAAREYDETSLMFEDRNVLSEVISRRGIINVMVLPREREFMPAEDDMFPRKKRPKKKKVFGVEVIVPLSGAELEQYPYFAFMFRPERPEAQDVELFAEGEKRKKNVGKFARREYRDDWEHVEINFRDLDFDARGLIIRLRLKAGALSGAPGAREWYRFQLKDVRLHERFPYPLKSEANRERFQELLGEVNPELVRINEEVFRWNDFEREADFNAGRGGVLAKKISLAPGNHRYEKQENGTLETEWTILEPEAGSRKTAAGQEPEIIFKKINPTKYLVKVEGARAPFWLVFSESFHEQWRLYLNQKPETGNQRPEEIVAEYAHLGVKEARHSMKFTPGDIRFLFAGPLAAPHHLVNGYANGWYIEPGKLGLGEDFELVIYFFPQSLFYLGLGISGITLLGCLGYLGYCGIKRKKRKSPLAEARRTAHSTYAVE